MTSTKQPIAIIGIGSRFPKATDADRFWDNIAAGRTAFSRVPADRWNHTAFFAKSQRDVDKAWVDAGSFLEGYKDFAAMHYGIAPRRLEVMDPQQRLLIEATRWAIQDAGYETKTFNRRSTGVFVGVSISEFQSVLSARMNAMRILSGEFGGAASDQATIDAVLDMTANVAPMRAFTLSGNLTALAGAAVAQVHDLGGPAYTIDSACASASIAIHDAVTQLRAGQIDNAIAGGAYLNFAPDNLVCFTKIGAISPSGACRPFEKRADGFVQSDAVGLVFLKRLDDALKDGDRIHAVIVGSGANNDGRGEGPMTPRVPGQLDVLGRAYDDAGVSPASVAYFEAHGTATNIGDPVEVESLGTFLLDAGVEPNDKRPIGSVKGNIGHAMSAAGIAGLVKALKVVQHREAPPQPNFEETNPTLGMDRWPLEVSTSRAPLAPKGDRLRVAVSSFGFGGTNSHIVLEEPPAFERDAAVAVPLPIESDDIRPEAIVVSAPTEALLEQHLAELADWFESGAGRTCSLADAAYTLNARRRHERFRTVVAARTAAELVENLRRPAIVHDAALSDDEPKKIAFLFPGQGAQRVGLLADVRERFGVFADAMARFEAKTSLAKPLSDYLYADDATEDALRATEICQPAMAAVGLSLSALLESAGVRPDVTLGHSLGEFVALAAGGAIDPAVTVDLVAKRGAAMRDLALDDTGAMAAVMTDADKARAVVADIDGVAVANVNHPRQVSISGTTGAVEAATKAFEAEGIDVKPLSVSHAFHSPLLDGVDRAVAGLLEGLEIREATATVASCIADHVHGDASSIRDVLVAHATAPVEFVRGLHQAREAGATIFVQVGAGSMLTSFARASLGDEITTVTMASEKRDGGFEVVRGLATLRALGVDVDFEAVYAGEGRRVVSLPETPLERQPYWPVKDAEQPIPEMQPVDPAEGVRAVSAAPVAAAAAPANAEPSLVELFEQQNRLLEQHAEIIAQQNRVLLGGGDAPVAAPKPTVAERIEAAIVEPVAEPAAPAPAPQAEPAAPTPPPVAEEGVEERVFEVVAKISAFPRDHLRGEQRLVDELGFDSLMVADLGGALQNTFPKLGALPPDLFDMTTTLGDIASHVAKTVSGDQPEVEEETPAEIAAATRYRVRAVQQPRPALGSRDPSGEHWLVTEDDTAIGTAVSAELEARGATVMRVRFARDGVAAPAQLNVSGLNLWPRAFVDGLPDAIEQTGVKLAGFVHAAAVGLSDASDFENPVLLLHPLASRLDVATIATVTALGGRLGLEKSARLTQNILQSALLGYMKSLARERPTRTIRALDVDDTIGQVAPWIADELLGADRTPAVGWDGARWIAELEAAPVGGAVKRQVKSDDVVLITGGAGEIGSVVAKWFAAQKPKAIILVGRRQKDARIEKLLAELGTNVRYVAADATKVDALREIGEPVTVAVHAAGLIEDAPVSKKSVESIQRVMDTKIRAMQSLLIAFPALRDLVLFSSWAARFGNAGQADYAAANELMDRIAVAGVGATRVVSIDWPPWSETKMVASIPEGLRRAMAAQGVTFLDNEEGTALFERIFVEGSAGIELVGRTMPARETNARAVVDFDVAAHPYLDDHKIHDKAVVPLASVADVVAWTFTQTASTSGSLVLSNLELVRGVFGGDVATATLTGRRTEDTDQARVDVRVADNVAYRAQVATEGKQKPPALVALEGASEAISTPLDRFYAEQTFHGPMMRGIESVERMTSQGIRGVVRTSLVADFVPGTSRTEWAVDPLVVDGAFQLAGYWLFAHHGRAGFPIGFERFVLLRPFGTESVHATVVLDDIDDVTFTGRIVFATERGELYGWLDGIRGRFAEIEAKQPASNGAGHTVDVPQEAWDIAAFPEVEQLEQRFEMAKLIGLDNPYFAVHAGTAKDTSVIDGVEMLNFSSYNYLGFSGHPRVVEAAQASIEKYGTSVSASRVASGERPLHRELETKIAEHVGVDDAIVYVSGHATNVTTIGHMLDRNDLVVHDSLIHDSILQGIYLSGATRRPYAHGDLDALERTLAQTRNNYRRVLLCAEGIYSMDGDICDLPRLVELKKRFKCLLLVDEAHSIGVLGPSGRGVAHHFDGVDPRDIDMWMGTLSKSFASCGGYIAGSAALVKYLKYTAPGFVYSAGITPPNAAAALESLALMHEHPEVVETLRARSRFFMDYAKERGIDTGLAMGAAVVPAIIGNSLDCMKLSQALKGRRINVQPIVYPAVEDDAARLRFFISALHSEEQLRHTVDVMVEELAKIRGGEEAVAGQLQP